MKTLLIHQAFVSPSEAGGTRHFEFARHCVDRGHEFVIVASDLSYLTGKKTVSSRALVAVEEKNGVRVLRAYTIPSLHRSFKWRILSFLSFMCTSAWAGLKAGKVDVVMGTSPPIFQAFSAWLIAALRAKPFLIEVRDLWPDFAIEMGVLKNKVLISLARCLEQFLYNRANRILVNSPAYRDYLLGKGVPASKVVLIPNGVSPNMFDPNARGEKVRSEFGLRDEFVIVYAGALGLANDIPTILNAAALLHHEQAIKFLLVGDGKEAANLQGMAKSMNLSNVIFAGARPKSDMKQFLAAADACVATLQNIPLFKTTYPNKVFDYMAAARPTILAIEGVIQKVMEDASGGICVPAGNPTAIAEAALRLSRDPLHARSLGANARRHVERHFNRQRHAQDFEALVRAMVNQ